MSDMNTAPTFDNLPSTVNLLETAGGGTVVQTLTVTDAEGDPVDTTCSVSPVDEAYKFVFETDPGTCAREFWTAVSETTSAAARLYTACSSCFFKNYFS